MKKVVLATALIALLASPAFAGTQPKADSVVTSDRVTLGDVFDGVTENAGHYLAPAPAPGKTLALGAPDLQRISNAFNLGWTPADGTRVIIRRATDAIDRYDIQAAVQDKLRTLADGAFEAELTDPSTGFQVPASGDRTVSVDRLEHDAVKGTFRAVVSAAADPSVKKEVSGRAYAITQIPVLKSARQAGDVISAADVDYVDMRSTDVTPAMMTDASHLIGRTPRRGIQAMKPVTLSDVRLPLAVKKGDLVTMTLSNAGISLTAQGRAMENGAVGEAIPVMNSASKKVVDAVITGTQAVRIGSPAANLL